MSEQAKRAAIYCRISDDKSGDALGVGRQRTDCEALIQQRGWEVSGVYTDNSRSAYSGKPRPEYDRMMIDVEAGRHDVIVAWHNDRLHRRPVELEHFIEVVERARVGVATVRGGDVDLSTPTGRAMARYMGVGARLESEHKSDRIRRKALESAQAGRPSGGARPYGFEADKITHNVAEAAVIRECADRILAGETPYALARDLNARSITTASGGKWSANTLKRVMCSPRIAGLRQHVPRETGTRQANGGLYRGEGDLYPAAWEPIIPRRKWERVRARADRAERRNGTGRKYLLTGLLICHACGRHLVGQPNAGQAAYQCARAAGGCGKVCAKAEPIEEWVLDLVREAISKGDLTLAEPSDTTELGRVVSRLREVESDLRAIDDERAEGTLDRERWRRLSDRLTARRDSLRAQRDGLEAAEDRIRWTSDRWVIDWNRDQDYSRRAAMLRTVLRPMTVGPGRPGRGHRVADRLSAPEWLL